MLEEQKRRCLFLEVAPWESERIEKELGDCGKMEISTETLEESTVDEPESFTVLSPSTHSSIDADALDRFPNVKLITTRSTGIDHIDLEACHNHGVVVCNVPTYGANTVAEHTFGLILSLTRRVHKAHEQAVHGKFNLEKLRGFDLRGRTLGVVGTGSIGTHVIRIALGFQMNVIAYDVHPVHQMADALGFAYVDMERLLSEADIVTLHAPYNEKTHHMIDHTAVASMKKGAFLINTARGGLVNTEALVGGLESKQLGGAGLDVLEHEQAIIEEGQLLSKHYDAQGLKTLLENNILLRMENVIITPHIGFNSAEALDKILATTLQNIAAFEADRPQNEVSVLSGQ